MVVRGEVLDENEAGDTTRGLGRGRQRQLLLVFHDSNLEFARGQLDNNWRRLFARGWGEGAEA